jgi:hypothetical protein
MVIRILSKSGGRRAVAAKNRRLRCRRPRCGRAGVTTNAAASAADPGFKVRELLPVRGKKRVAVGLHGSGSDRCNKIVAHRDEAHRL